MTVSAFFKTYFLVAGCCDVYWVDGPLEDIPKALITRSNSSYRQANVFSMHLTKAAHKLSAEEVDDIQIEQQQVFFLNLSAYV